DPPLPPRPGAGAFADPPPPLPLVLVLPRLEGEDGGPTRRQPLRLERRLAGGAVGLDERRDRAPDVAREGGRRPDLRLGEREGRGAERILRRAAAARVDRRRREAGAVAE